MEFINRKQGRKFLRDQGNMLPTTNLLWGPCWSFALFRGLLITYKKRLFNHNLVSKKVYVFFLCRSSTNAFHSDSSESCASEKDPLSQRFSVAVHPHLPVILSSDGYLVTVMQLPPVASYHGIMTGFMRDITRCAVHFKSDFIWLWGWLSPSLWER